MCWQSATRAAHGQADTVPEEGRDAATCRRKSAQRANGCRIHHCFRPTPAHQTQGCQERGHADVLALPPPDSPSVHGRRILTTRSIRNRPVQNFR